VPGNVAKNVGTKMPHHEIAFARHKDTKVTSDSSIGHVTLRRHTSKNPPFANGIAAVLYAFTTFGDEYLTRSVRWQLEHQLRQWPNIHRIVDDRCELRLPS